MRECGLILLTLTNIKREREGGKEERKERRTRRGKWHT